MKIRVDPAVIERAPDILKLPPIPVAGQSVWVVFNDEGEIDRVWQG